MITLNTLIANGGATLTSKLNVSRIKTGYMVSLPNTEQIIPLEKLTQKALDYLIVQYKYIAEKGQYIGLWIDNNKMYADISINIKDRAKAIETGNDYKQLAIFDIVALDSIYMEGL